MTLFPKIARTVADEDEEGVPKVVSEAEGSKNEAVVDFQYVFDRAL